MASRRQYLRKRHFLALLYACTAASRQAMRSATLGTRVLRPGRKLLIGETMFYKTLYSYILRELFKIFFLTAGILTIMLAFGGTFRPLTKEGLNLQQLLAVLMDLMPAMLAYAIPLAALFAAVLVYWRLATDNELTACRAGGVSYAAVVFPALVLGLAVASSDLLFVNYVVPIFLQKTEHAVRRDIASLLLYNVGQQQPFRFGNLVIYADSAYRLPLTGKEKPRPGVRRTIVQMRGLAATPLRHNKPTAIVVAQVANIIIDRVLGAGRIEVRVQLRHGAAFDPKNFRKISGTVRSLPPDGKPYVLHSLISHRPKFMNNTQLKKLYAHPFHYAPVHACAEKIRALWEFQHIARQYYRRWKPNRPLLFRQGNHRRVIITSRYAGLSKNDRLFFGAAPRHPVRVELFKGKKRTLLYTCGSARLMLMRRQFPAKTVGGSLELRINVRVANSLLHGRLRSGPPIAMVQPLEIPHSMDDPPPARIPGGPNTPAMLLLKTKLAARWEKLKRNIRSEMQSRGSFAFSCLILVMLGAALGILLRGRNPLAVFVVGFVPSILLVLLITAGQKMVERSSGSDVPGLAVIWAGNGLILLFDAVVYGKLLRQ